MRGPTITPRRAVRRRDTSGARASMHVELAHRPEDDPRGGRSVFLAPVHVRRHPTRQIGLGRTGERRIHHAQRVGAALESSERLGPKHYSVQVIGVIETTCCRKLIAKATEQVIRLNQVAPIVSMVGLPHPIEIDGRIDPLEQRGCISRMIRPHRGAGSRYLVWRCRRDEPRALCREPVHLVVVPVTASDGDAKCEVVDLAERASSCRHSLVERIDDAALAIVRGGGGERDGCGVEAGISARRESKRRFRTCELAGPEFVEPLHVWDVCLICRRGPSGAPRDGEAGIDDRRQRHHHADARRFDARGRLRYTRRQRPDAAEHVPHRV